MSKFCSTDKNDQLMLQQKRCSGLIWPNITLRPPEFKIINSFVKGQPMSFNSIPNNYVGIRGNINILSMVETDTVLTSCKYSEDHDYLCVGTTDGIIRLFDPYTMELKNTLYDKDVTIGGKNTVNALTHRPPRRTNALTNTLVAVYENGFIKGWNYHLNEPNFTIKEKRQILGCCYHPRLTKFITYGSDAKINMYDEETRLEERVFQATISPKNFDGHSGDVYAAAFNPKSNFEFVTGGWDDTIQFWDTRQPHSVRYIAGYHISGEGLAFNATGTQILSCSYQKKNPLQMLDYASGKMIMNVEPDELNSKLIVGKYLDPTYFACGGEDPNILRVMDTRIKTSQGVMTDLTAPVRSITVGHPKKLKKLQKRQSKKSFSIDPHVSKSSEYLHLPRIAFISGKKIYQIDFQ